MTHFAVRSWEKCEVTWILFDIDNGYFDNHSKILTDSFCLFFINKKTIFKKRRNITKNYELLTFSEFCSVNFGRGNTIEKEYLTLPQFIFLKFGKRNEKDKITFPQFKGFKYLG